VKKVNIRCMTMEKAQNRKKDMRPLFLLYYLILCAYIYNSLAKQSMLFPALNNKNNNRREAREGTMGDNLNNSGAHNSGDMSCIYVCGETQANKSGRCKVAAQLTRF
jgi:hypothetical protein